jgi:serine/threonine protein kinase
MENINKETLITFSYGSFGIILFDNYNNVYKLSLLFENGFIIKNNIIECSMLNKKLYKNNSKNILTAIVEIYNLKDLFNKYNFDYKCTKLLKNCNLDDYVFFSKMKKYDINLYDYIKKYKINNFTDIAKELILGLNVLHQNNFLHGDLKLANIMINNPITDLKIVLIDYGGMKTLNSIFYNRTCTITYRCPEEINYDVHGNNNYYKPSLKNDIWSLGIIFSELLFYKSFMNDYYIKINDSCKTFDKNNENENENFFEEKFLNLFKKKKVIDITLYAEEYNIKNIDNKIINIINKMLSIDTNNRYNNLNEVYYDFFNKNIIDDNNDDYMINYTYDLNIDINNFQKLQEIRKKYYEWLLNFYTNDEILLILPLTFNIADRYYCIILTKNISINNFSINYDINKIIMICCNLLSMVFLYTNLPIIKDIRTFFNIKNIKLNHLNIILQYYLSNILIYLDYDIYRPYVDNNLTPTIYDDKELFLKYKNKLYKMIYYNIISDKVNITPEDYLT